MTELLSNNEYRTWLSELKSKIRRTQIKAAISVNTEMILLYWDIGRQIVEKQENAKWGSGFINQLSEDLSKEFPDIRGFSTDNIRFMKRLYVFYSQKDTIFAQVVQELNNNPAKLLVMLPWGHHTLILRKIKQVEEALLAAARVRLVVTCQSKYY